MRLWWLIGIVFAQQSVYWDTLFYPEEQLIVYGSAPRRLRLQAQRITEWLLEKERPPISWPLKIFAEVPAVLVAPLWPGIAVNGYLAIAQLLALFPGRVSDSLRCECLVQAAYLKLKVFYFFSRMLYFWQRFRGESSVPLYALGLTSEILGCSAPLRGSVFVPTPRTCNARPVVVFLHSGGYSMGSYRNADMRYLARSFAARGYVTASIEYRLGLSHFSEGSVLSTSIQAMHDLKAFIRYLKRSVVEWGNPFGIDTNRIYVGGSSAGAITALHAAYVTDVQQLQFLPYLSLSWLAKEGGIEGLSGNMGYSSAFSGVFSLSGAMLRANWIDSSRTKAIAVFHGTEDPIIPFKRGGWPTPRLKWEGGFVIDSVAAAKGLYHALAVWEGPFHSPFWKSNEEINPPFMQEVETFLRYHFYQWNKLLGERCE